MGRLFQCWWWVSVIFSESVVWYAKDVISILKIGRNGLSDMGWNSHQIDQIGLKGKVVIPVTIQWFSLGTILGKWLELDTSRDRGTSWGLDSWRLTWNRKHSSFLRREHCVFWSSIWKFKCVIGVIMSQNVGKWSVNRWYHSNGVEWTSTVSVLWPWKSSWFGTFHIPSGQSHSDWIPW